MTERVSSPPANRAKASPIASSAIRRAISGSTRSSPRASEAGEHREVARRDGRAVPRARHRPLLHRDVERRRAARARRGPPSRRGPPCRPAASRASRVSIVSATAERLERVVGAAVGLLAEPALDVVARRQDVAVAPSSAASSSFAGTTSTATIAEAPAILAPCTTERPTPPQPITTHVSPGRIRPC